MSSYDSAGTGENPIIVQDRGEADAVATRQNHIIALLRGVRALAAAIVILFFILGLAGALMVRQMNDARDTTRRLARDQKRVVCDGYSHGHLDPPAELECP